MSKQYHYVVIVTEAEGGGLTAYLDDAGDVHLPDGSVWDDETNEWSSAEYPEDQPYDQFIQNVLTLGVHVETTKAEGGR